MPDFCFINGYKTKKCTYMYEGSSLTGRSKAFIRKFPNKNLKITKSYLICIVYGQDNQLGAPIETDYKLCKLEINEVDTLHRCVSRRPRYKLRSSQYKVYKNLNLS